ncbi:hypothetical protein [Bellilinea caldifistulae]|nr:hypothetical protein [Bellilinea caldifistulae]
MDLTRIYRRATIIMDAVHRLGTAALQLNNLSNGLRGEFQWLIT